MTESHKSIQSYIYIHRGFLEEYINTYITCTYRCTWELYTYIYICLMFFFLISLPSVIFAFPTFLLCGNVFVCLFVFVCLYFVSGFFGGEGFCVCLFFYFFFVLSFFHKKLFQMMLHFKAIPPKLNRIHRNIFTTLVVKNILNYKKIFNLLKLDINYHINPLVWFFFNILFSYNYHVEIWS